MDTDGSLNHLSLGGDFRIATRTAGPDFPIREALMAGDFWVVGLFRYTLVPKPKSFGGVGKRVSRCNGIHGREI